MNGANRIHQSLVVVTGALWLIRRAHSVELAVADAALSESLDDANA